MNGQACVTRPVYGLNDFRYDKELGVYMNPSGIGADEAAGGEEGIEYIGRALKSVKDLAAYSRELTYYIKDWPSRYHLSPMRNNLLEGIAELFDKNSTVLEVGSECGAITRWLGEKFRAVDSIEGGLQRAVTARMRTSGLENVRVYFGDISKTSLNKKYDIITLMGMLAYVPLYDRLVSDPSASCIRMLSRLNESLNEKGILVLAIENKLGIKYLSGCSEEHTGKRFIGIHGYTERSPVTFSRNELESILRKSGFDSVQFYHSFPDYKLAGTVIQENDEALSLRPYNWIKTPFEDHYGTREYTLLEPLFLKTITDAGLLWQFSNSFLVLASRSDDTELKAGWLIKRFNNESHDGKFRHQVILEKEGGSKYMVKRKPAIGNEPHVNAGGIEFRLENEEYVRGELLSLKLYRAMLDNGQRTAVKHTLETLHDSLVGKYSTGRPDGGGYPLVRGDAVDYTFWNLILSEDGALRFIDRKWRISGDIPVDFVLFRNLFYIYRVVYPFIKEKSRPAFIVDMIRALYPQYSLKRLKHDAALEEEFQSAISNKKVLQYIDYPPRASIMAAILRRLKGALAKQRAGVRPLKNRGNGDGVARRP